MRPFSDATRIDVEESHIKENEMKVRVDYYAVLKVSATDLASVFDEADFYATEALGRAYM